MSILAKDCPLCGETNPAYAVRCRCGYEFNETVDCGEEQDDLALTVQEEELYLEYLQARAQQATADAQNATQAAAAHPNNKAAASQAERAQLAAQTATAELESQQARVATAIKTLQGNNRASPLADSGSARQTSAPATPQALPSTAAPPRTPPEATAPPAAAAKSEAPRSAISPGNRSTPTDMWSKVHTGATATDTPVGAEPRKPGGGATRPAPTTPEKAPAPSTPAAAPATPGLPAATAGPQRERSTTPTTTSEQGATPPINNAPADLGQAAAGPKANATRAPASKTVQATPTTGPTIDSQDGGKRDDTSTKPSDAAPKAPPKPAPPAVSADKPEDAAAAKALAAAARAKELTEKLKAAQAARAAKTQRASPTAAAKTAPSAKTAPAESGPVTQTGAPVPQTAPQTPAASPNAVVKPANGQHHEGSETLAANLDAIQIPGAEASEAQPASPPAASRETPRSEPEPKRLDDTPAAPPAPAAGASGGAPTVTVSVAPSVDPQEELEAALRALTTRPPAPTPNEPPAASPVEPVAAAQPQQADAVETTPAIPPVAADQKDCPNCTALLPLKEMRCRCGYTFPTVDEAMPSLSLSDSDLAAMGDESPRNRITHLS